MIYFVGFVCLMAGAIIGGVMVALCKVSAAICREEERENDRDY